MPVMPWELLTVEFAVCGWILLVLTADLLLPLQRKSLLWMLSLAGVGVAAVLLGWQEMTGLRGTFQGMIVVDGFSRYFKWLFLLTVGVIIVMTREFTGLPTARAKGSARIVP